MDRIDVMLSSPFFWLIAIVGWYVLIKLLIWSYRDTRHYQTDIMKEVAKQQQELLDQLTKHYQQHYIPAPAPARIPVLTPAPAPLKTPRKGASDTRMLIVFAGISCILLYLFYLIAFAQ